MENNQIDDVKKIVSEIGLNDITNIKTFKSAWYQALKEVRGVGGTYDDNNTWSIACSKLIEFYEGDIESSTNSETKKRKAFIKVKFVVIAFTKWLDSHNERFLLTDINFRRRFRQFKNTVSHHNALDVVGLTWETPIAKMNGHFKQR